MPKPLIPNVPSQQNSNRPSSPSKGAHPISRSVSGQTSKSATPGKQRRTASSSAANGKEGFVPVKLPTIQSELQEVQNPILLPSLPDPTLSSRKSTPRKADKLPAVLPPSPGENGFHSLAPHVFMLLPSTEATPKTYRRSLRGHNTVASVADDEPSRSFLSSASNFFAWSPTSGVDEERISGSSSTRRPARWDRHLHEKLILKKVVSAPELTSRLGETADSALERTRANLSHSKADQLSEKTKILGAACIKNTEYEREVRNFYKESIAPPCLAAAGVLGFGTAGDFLKWQSKFYGQTQAKADGFLVVSHHGSDFLALPDEFKERIRLLEEWNLNVLAVWEFKSLAAGSKKTMGEILGLSSEESFPWTGCTPLNSCKSGEYHQNDLAPHKTGRKTSPDSLSPLIDSRPKVAKCSNAHTKRSPVKPKHIIQQVGFLTVSMLHTMLIVYLQGLGRSSTK